MIRICPNCSHVEIEKIKCIVGDSNVDVGCIGECGTEFKAYVKDELIEANSAEELIETIKTMVKI